MEKKTNSNFVIQGSILAVAGILVRLIGMLYRIPLNNIIDDEGIGYYSSAFSVYSIMLIVSSYSLPVAVSKMIAARIGERQYKNTVKILKASLFYATVVGGLACAILWFGAASFAASMKMPFAAFAIKTLAPTIWIMAYLGVLRGYFQGHGTMIPTAVSQIFEQIVNAIVSIVAASYLFKQGMKLELLHQNPEYSYAFGAAGGTIGTGAGAFTAFFILLALVLMYRTSVRKRVRRDTSGYIMSYGEISKIFFMTVFPVILSSAVYNISTVIDNYIYGNAVAGYQTSSQIASSWGVYMGKYRLLFNIPVAIANALSSSLIPSLSRAVAARDRKQIMSKVSTAIRFAMMVAIPSAVGLTVLAEPISNLLFRNTDNTLLIRLTMMGSIAVVFYSLSTVTNAILQGLNHMRLPIYHALTSLVIHIAILSTFLWEFKLGIIGVLAADILFAFIICFLNARSIRRHLRYRQEIKKTFVIPAISAAVMGLCSYGTYFLSNKVIKSHIFSTTAAIMVAVLVYGILLMKLKGIEEDELYSMPGGRKLARIASKLHLI